MPRRREQQGPGDFDLPQRQFPPVPGLPAGRGERDRDHRGPQAEERLDMIVTRPGVIVGCDGPAIDADVYGRAEVTAAAARAGNSSR
jgi:hypothetical protein